MTLDSRTATRALRVEASPGESVGRALMNGAVVIYNLDEPPFWLGPLLAARDEEGDVQASAPMPVSDMEAAWGLIANAWNGNWDEAPDEWREAAVRWRDEVWHAALDAGGFR